MGPDAHPLDGDMPGEIDFSTGTRGKFYRPDVAPPPRQPVSTPSAPAPFPNDAKGFLTVSKTQPAGTDVPSI